jgi:hypothetical protein
MPSTRLARRAFAATAALVGALAVVVVPAASAQAADECTTRTTTKAFAAFGDTNQYFAIGGGTFESGDLSPFALTGSPSIASENESFRVLGSTHTRSVALPAGSSLKATFCVQVGEDSMRLFTKSPGVSGGSLNIKTTVSTAYGSANTSSSLGGSYAATWAPTGRIPLTNVSGPDGKQYVTLLITNTGSGTWLVDDILVDPWKTL